MILLLMISVITISTIGISQSQATPDQVPERYIVVLNEDANPWSVANEMAQERGLSISHVYGNAINGFSGIVPPGQLEKLSSDPRVAFIEEDLPATIFAKKDCNLDPNHPGCKDNDDEPSIDPPSGPPQETPTGIDRIGGPQILDYSNIHVAVLDTGIAAHDDLNLVGGVNFAKGKASDFKDKHSHGTHVAGTIGALDNEIGVVGVAPGVNLWAVKVLGNNGMGFTSDIIAGLDWVAKRNNNGNLNDDIHVVNMSIGGTATSTNKVSSCGNDGYNDSYHDAICSVKDSGAIIVVAAGNSNNNANNYRPATWQNEVITVSALADFDGKAGGSGTGSISFSICTENNDDSFACFSNWGSDVDLIAPGVRISSTSLDNGYSEKSGTSMASPHVAGAVAAYLTTNQNPTNGQIISAITSSYLWDTDDDPENTREPLLDFN
jgi:subtilisin family serine protease